MKKKKVIGLMVAAVLLVSISVLGTIAYLTSTDTVENTFTVGKVAITLDEAATNENGDGCLIDGADRVKANSYKLMPGHTYLKDPRVTVVKGSEGSYIRMIVTISNAANLKEVFGNDFLPQNYVDDTWNSAEWHCYKTTPNEDNTITYEFRYSETVTALDRDVVLSPLFTQFTVPEGIVNSDLDKLQNTEVDIVAEAIQADGFGDEDAAWAAFK